MKLDDASKARAKKPLDIIYYLIKCICTHDCRQDRHASSLHRLADDGSTEAVHVSCKRLECFSCGPHVVDLYVQKIAAAIKQYSLTCFVTLTYARLIPENIKKQLSKMIKLLRSKLDKDMRYLWVIGGDSRAKLHYHLLIDRKISKNQLRILWMSCGGGQQVDLKSFPMADSGRLASYMVRNWLESYKTAPAGRRMAYSRGMKLNLEKNRNTGANWQFRPRQSTGAILQVGGYSPHVMGTGGGVNPPAVYYNPRIPMASRKQDPDAPALEQSTQGGGVLRGSGATGTTSVPATPPPVGAPVVCGKEGAA
jgi:hypothetical protein